MLISTSKSAAIYINRSPRNLNSSTSLISCPSLVRPNNGVTFTCGEGLNWSRGLSSSFAINDQQQSHPLHLQESQEKLIWVDFWKVVFCNLKGMSRDEIIDFYIKCLASVLGSSISPEILKRLEKLPTVWDAFCLTARDMTDIVCTGEPFINGQPIPYDPKYYAHYERRMKACHMHLRFSGMDAPPVPHNRLGKTFQESDPNFGSMSLGENVPQE